MRIFIKPIILWVFFLSFTLGFGQKGAELYKKHQCHTCHGEKGDKPIATTYPKINGQYAAYSLIQMKDIQSGKRDNGQSLAMKVLMKDIPVKDLEIIAKYLETLK